MRPYLVPSPGLLAHGTPHTTPMPRLHTPIARRARPCALLLALLLAGCGGARQADAPGTAPGPPPPPVAVPAMDLGGNRVLVLPVQAASGIEGGRDRATAEILFALRDRDARTPWVAPDDLRNALRRSPGYAPDPGALPSDPYMHHRERRIAEPLVGVVRRYSALMNTRLVLILREARFHPRGEAGEGAVRLHATMVDSRTGAVVWYGEADGAVAAQGDPVLLPSAAAALAARMVMADSQ
jgi:hypothetical protein